MTGMAPPESPPRKTLEDYLALPDVVRAELIGGELYVTPSPTPRHQEASDNLMLVLGGYVRRRGLGRMYSAPLDVHLPSGDVVQPDLLFVATASEGIVQDWIRGVPDLVVEVLSPSNAERDRIVKRDVYAQSGVPEYWIVDPEARSIQVLRHEAGTYRPAGWFRSGDRVRSETWPDLDLPVDEAFL
jgi:Uma2 family endonuclease